MSEFNMERFYASNRRIAQLEAELQQVTAQRDKWLDAFNRSEQFQSGPTKRAEKAEAELQQVRAAKAEVLHCHSCGKSVSTAFFPVPTDTPDKGLIVRAWIECPECIEKRDTPGAGTGETK